MKIGITGSRYGMTSAQHHSLDRLFAKLAARLAAGEWESITIIHGDCKGVDAQADALARQHGFETACHPGNIERWRAYTGAEELSEPAIPHIRNYRIVGDVAWLIAIPRKGARGTWMTYGMANSKRKPRTVIEMDGTVDTKKGDDE